MKNINDLVEKIQSYYPAADVEPVRLKKRLPSGFQIHRYSVEAQGLCPACAAER